MDEFHLLGYDSVGMEEIWDVCSVNISREITKGLSASK